LSLTSNMSLKIVGAGQPRTGTNSLQHALEILGFGPCYHMYHLLTESPEDVHFFISARDTGEADWATLFSSFKSAVDFPASLYYKSILKTYPNAKIILSTRDDESWYRSISETIFKAHKPTFLKKAKTLLSLPFSSGIRKRLRVLSYAGRMIKEFYGPDLEDKTSVIEKFNTWNQKVSETIPKEQLLIFDVKEGWEPLCTFLNVPVPTVPFPKINSTEEFKKRTRSI
jgi:Sulfotransferase domain